MSIELTRAELLRLSEIEREALRAFAAERLRAGASPAALAFGMAALLGNICATVARRGYLDELLVQVRCSVSANAHAALNAQATSEGGHA